MALTRAQIQTAFQNSLGRAASASDENSYFSVSQSGALSDAQIFSTISNSREADQIADPVIRFYQAAFGRVPDQAGLQNAENFVRAFGPSAATYQNLSNMFAQSQEFTNRFGTGTAVDAAYVQALYSTILGRTATNAEVDGYVSGAAGYTTRGAVLYAVSQSQEAISISDSAVNNFQLQAAQGNGTYTGSLSITPVSTIINLTNNVDTITGSTGNDVINGTAAGGTGGTPGTGATFTAGDRIDGGAGNDTLSINDLGTGGTLNPFAVAGVQVSNVEKIVIASGEAVTVDTSTANTAGVTQLNIAAAGVVQATAATSTSVTISDSAAAAVTVIGGGNNASITAGAGAVAVGNAGAGAANANSYTTVAVTGGTTVAVTDNSGATAGDIGTKLGTISLSGNTGAATLTGNGITNVSISNGVAASDVTITDTTAAHALNLTVSNDATGLVITDATAGTVSIAASGAASAVAIAAATATALNVSGTGTLTLDATGSNYSALTKVGVTQTGTFTADLSGATNLTTIDASSSTGTNNVTVSVTETYLGGSGVDKVSIGATPTTGTISGGAGASDVLVVTGNATGIDTASTKITGFEILGAGAGAQGTFSGANFTAVEVDGTLAAATTFNALKAGTALTYNAVGGQDVTYTLADATGTSDTATLNLGNTTTAGLATAGNTTSFAGVETVTVNSLGTGTTGTNTVKIADGALKALVITGGEALTISSFGGGGATDTTLLASVNASAATKAIDTTGLTLASGSTVIGGSAADAIKAAAGLSTLTGGGGADAFSFTANANGNTYATVTDFTKTTGTGTSAVTGDSLNLTALKVNAFAANTTIAATDKISLASTAAFADYLSAASAATTGGTNAVFKYFNYQGDTYGVVDNSNNATFTNGVDQVVKLTGVIDLTGATITAATSVLQA
ncbi:DUF4214 domain-containing protein [Methylobacterium sp. E-016]|uniref:DUF4214 domain-containing protein n=1 Tax=Methylobacterium sp. E-016 TaxID=2836556 RepID=UPI001FBB1358|nr:DUF4214 domain-containing protein [Methylobacterium sp. E-016]MCJ2074288.1 DUF4214 domain-containing protein [Methylobacterium sp. E-016]